MKTEGGNEPSAANNIALYLKQKANMATAVRRSPRLAAKAGLVPKPTPSPVSDFIGAITPMKHRRDIVVATEEFFRTYKVDMNTLSLDYLKQWDLENMNHCVVIEYIIERMTTPNTDAMKAYLSMMKNKKNFPLIGVYPITEGGTIQYKRYRDTPMTISQALQMGMRLWDECNGDVDAMLTRKAELMSQSHSLIYRKIPINL